MKHLHLIALLFISVISNAQISTKEYCKQNTVDMGPAIKYDFSTSKVVGFGALHGSQDTEEVERRLLEILSSQNLLDVYLPETDYCTASYFEEFLKTGDQNLLYNLVLTYGLRVPQEASVAVFNKWIKMRELYKEHPFLIIGTDKIANYKYPIKKLVELTKENAPHRDILVQMNKDTLTNKSAYLESHTKRKLRKWADKIAQLSTLELVNEKDTAIFKHIISDLEVSFTKKPREVTIFDNYCFLANQMGFKEKHQFVRYGVFHLMKERINGASSFFNQLIESDFYKATEITTIQGLFDNSQVLWNIKWDKEGNYKGYTISRGFGTSDAFYEYVKGIRNFKKQGKGGFKFLDLKKENSPYMQKECTDFVEVVLPLRKSHWNMKEGTITTDYLDIVILMVKSKASKPVQELRK